MSQGIESKVAKSRNASRIISWFYYFFYTVFLAVSVIPENNYVALSESHKFLSFLELFPQWYNRVQGWHMK